MSIHVGTLFHWSPTRNRRSILKSGLIVSHKRSRLASEFVAPYICLATTPSSGWALIGEPEQEGFWDLWQVQVREGDQLTIRGDYAPMVREVRVHNGLPVDRVWLVGSREA